MAVPDKIRVREYGDPIVKNGPQARESVLVRGIHKITGGEVKLVEISEGWACAGSMARYDAAAYGVVFMVDGARHGQRFTATDAGLSRARRRFVEITKESVA